MVKNTKKNGRRVGRGKAKVLALTRKPFRRTSIDLFGEDFCNVAEVSADDVLNGRIDVATHSAATRAYGNMLRMLDLQMRARKMGLIPAGAKLLTPMAKGKGEGD